MKMRALEDQGSSPEEDNAQVRFQRKQGPTQERSTTVPMTPASNSITEGMEASATGYVAPHFCWSFLGSLQQLEGVHVA